MKYKEQYQDLVAQIRKKKEEAVDQAIKSLAGYKFWMFGYHAADWVKLNKLDPDPEPSPFYRLVSLAKEMRQFSVTEEATDEDGS